MNGKMQLTRAELVRLRRAKENAKRLQLAARRAPPIVTRAKKDVVKPKSKPASLGVARRRFQIALPKMPGANFRAIRIPHIHIPRIRFPRPRLGWRALSFILAALLGLAVYFAFNRPELRVTEARIIGNQMLTPAEINAVLNVAGQPVFVLIPSDLETRLRLNFPELVSVKVEAALPNLVSVNIVERQPVIRWEQGGGYTWIAEDGIAFRPRGEVLGLIPVAAVSGPSVSFVSAQDDPLTPAPFISSEMVQALKGLVGHVPQGAQILYDAGLGFGWNDPRGWRVYFGTGASDVELKMRVYEAMVNSLTQRGIRPALINVTYPTAPYYRMSQ